MIQKLRMIGGLCTLTTICLAALLGTWVSSSHAGEKSKILVGRVSHVEGQLLRYVYEENDWASVAKDAPFSMDDALYTDQDAKSELILPNGTWIRIGGSTQLQLIQLEPDVTEVDVAAGMSRLINKSEDCVLKVTTPFGYVVAYGGTSFDVYVGEESVEVISITGQVDFVHQGDDSRYEVIAGSESVVADSQQIVAGEGFVAVEWDDWNLSRDEVWSKRVQVKGDSIEYLPEVLREDAYAFEENGRWEKVYHDGEYRTLWKPTRVSEGWAPYTSGRWSVYYGDNCWIPDEPFGYATHHYGNWVRVDSCNCWYWSPPPVNRVAVRRAYNWYEDYDWCPGRVGWIHSDSQVGWIPLAPSEPYYSHNYWGASSIVLGTVAPIQINIGRHRWFDDAVIVDQDNFYRVNNYRNVRVTNINKTTIINNYRSAHVVNNRVIRDYDRVRERYNFTHVRADRTPHDSVLKRIERNQRIARENRNIRGTDIGDDLNKIKQGKITREGHVGRPEVTNRLVARDQRNRPDTEVPFQKNKLVQNGRQIQDAPHGTRVLGEGQLGGLQGNRFENGARNSSMGGVAGEGRLRPVKPGRDVGSEISSPKEGSLGGREMSRPVRPGRDVQPPEGELTGRGGPEGRLRPVKPGRDVGSEISSPREGALGGREMSRPVRPGRDVQPPEGELTGRGGPEGRLRPVKPGRDVGSEISSPREGALGGREMSRPVRPGREGQPPEGGLTGQQRQPQVQEQRQQQMQQQMQEQRRQQQQEQQRQQQQQLQQQRQQQAQEQRQQQMQQQMQEQRRQQQQEQQRQQQQQLQQQRQQQAQEQRQQQMQQQMQEQRRQQQQEQQRQQQQQLQQQKQVQRM